MTPGLGQSERQWVWGSPQAGPRLHAGSLTLFKVQVGPGNEEGGMKVTQPQCQAEGADRPGGMKVALVGISGRPA